MSRTQHDDTKKVTVLRQHTTYRNSVSDLTAQKRAEAQRTQLLLERQQMQGLLDLMNGFS
jgi:hypothetical protein